MFARVATSPASRSMADDYIVAAARLLQARERAAQATHKPPVQPKETKK
jgi:hypothetical protein